MSKKAEEVELTTENKLSKESRRYESWVNLDFNIKGTGKVKSMEILVGGVEDNILINYEKMTSNYGEPYLSKDSISLPSDTKTLIEVKDFIDRIIETKEKHDWLNSFNETD